MDPFSDNWTDFFLVFIKMVSFIGNWRLKWSYSTLNILERSK